MNKTTLTKSEHYDVIKVFATFLVVLAHSTRMYTGSGVITPACESVFLSYLSAAIYTFHMPLFVAVSGMVYGFCIDDRGKYTDNVAFVKNKFIRLIIPYLFFGFAYVAPVMVLFGFSNSSYFAYCLRGILLSENSRHLWYILVLFEIFLICAVLKKYIQKWHVVFLIIFFALALTHNHVPGILQLSNLVYYIFFFYAGYLYNRYYEKLNGSVMINLIADLVLLALIIVLFGHRNNTVVGILIAVAGSMIAVNLTSLVPSRMTGSKVFISLKKDGFGIYLFHPMIIYVLYYYLGQKQINPILLSVGIAAIAFILSWGLTELFRKLRLGVLMGE